MKKSIVKGKSASPKGKKPAPKKKAVKAPKKDVEVEGLAEPEQPLFYYGPPPAIKALYTDSKFDKKIHPHDLIARMSKGESRSEICAAWGITYSKFNEWLDAYPDLAEAYAIGKPSFDAYYKQALRLSSFGQLKSVREGSLFFMMKNLAGFDESGGNHEFGDGEKAELEFVDDD